MTSSLLVSIVGVNILCLHAFFDIDEVTDKATLSDPNNVLNLFY